MDSVILKLKELMHKKDLIEKDIKSLNEILVAQKNVGMSGPLLDADHFPRSDIDVYSVRYARNKILCLNSDHKSLMHEIEVCLHELHGNFSLDKEGQQKMESDVSTSDIHEPFAMIGKVGSNSPADNGGLKAGDQVIKFGSLNKNNFSSLEDVAKITRYNKGHSLDLLVRRDKQLLQLSIVPTTWSGCGLLGCTFIPIGK